MQIAIATHKKLQFNTKLQAKLAARRRRKAAHARLMVRLDNLTDPTLIHRMHRTHQLERNIKRYELEQQLLRVGKQLRAAAISFNGLGKSK
jgi:hypothetical protein